MGCLSETTARFRGTVSFSIVIFTTWNTKVATSWKTLGFGLAPMFGLEVEVSVLKGAVIPDGCVVATNSVVN